MYCSAMTSDRGNDKDRIRRAYRFCRFARQDKIIIL